MEDLPDIRALRQTFVVEAGEHLDEIEEALIELEARPDDRAQLLRIFRVTHTFKGTAGSLGFHGLTDLGHVIEDMLEVLHRSDAPATQAVCNALLEATDAARRMLPDVLAGIDELRPAAKEALHKLKRLIQEAPSEPADPQRQRADAREEVAAFDARVRTVRVEVAKLDRMVALMGEVAAGRSRLRQRIVETGGPAAASLLEALDQTERFHAELEGVLRTVRMVPIGPWLHQYARAVRDVAQAHGKQARLVVEGGDAEADLAVLDRLRDPLTHLIRNTLDHGIESPLERRVRGKDPKGTVTLSAWHEGGGVMLRVADDGAGLQRARIVAQARARGIRDVDARSADDLHRLVFEPGFSTAEELSDLSGRGVGLSVVHQRIKALRGSIRIDSTEGAGTAFTIRLPLTLATIDGVSVWACGERFVIPLDAVVECHDLPRGELPPGRCGLLHLRGKGLPCVRLGELFDLADPARAAPARETVVVVAHEGVRAGLVVDAVEGASRTMIKPLGQLFRGVSTIAGSTILGDGRVALILDVPALLRQAVERQAGALGAP